MKNRIYLSALLLILIVKAGCGQTNVSGNIIMNTTWTLANSPYIVVDTVVVMPGIALTINPGVTVKFADNKRIEIRQAKIISIGTASDSITFTSNNILPTTGIYGGIYINSDTTSFYSDKFSYCNFKFANNAILKSEYDTLIVKHCRFINDSSGIGFKFRFPELINVNSISIDSSSFRNNVYGIGTVINTYWAGMVSNVTLNYCTFSGNVVGLIVDAAKISRSVINSNQTGFWAGGGVNAIDNCIIDSNSTQGYYSFMSGNNDSIYNCEIKYNTIGIYDNNNYGSWWPKHILKNDIEYNTIGIKNLNTASIITCNKICNNSLYGYDHEVVDYIYIPFNYWCTSDSSSTSSVIHSMASSTNQNVFFMPIDTVSCLQSITVNATQLKNSIADFSIAPNPFTSATTIKFSDEQKNTTVKITDMLGKEIKTVNVTGKQCVIEKGEMRAGVYLVRIMDEKKNVVNRKMVVE